MRLALALGAAVAALSMNASAQPHGENRVFVLHAAVGVNADANNDGWISRAEARDQADAQFARMDRNNDGRLDESERGPHFRGGDDPNCTRNESSAGGERRVHVECHVIRIGEGGGGPRVAVAPHAPGQSQVFIHRSGEGGDCTTQNSSEGANRTITVTCDGEGERRVVVRHGENGDVEVTRNGETEENCRRTETGDAGNRRVTVICGDAAESGNVIVHRHDDGPIIAPLPPAAPMFANLSEADRNNDGFISREEYRNHALRFFDAADANRDGRIQAPPRPPEPPAPPAAPTPPRGH